MGEARAAGAWVKRQRLASGMTQEELAGRSGLSVRTISNLERGRTGRPHPRSLEVLAVALGLPEAAGTAWAARLRADQALDDSSHWQDAANVGCRAVRMVLSPWEREWSYCT